MSARALALAGIFGLLLLQWRWHAVIAPPTAIPPLALVALYCLPLLPSLWLLVRGRREALLAGALGSLLYFCHGVMFAMDVSPLRMPALTEIGLSVIVVVASSWTGLRSRFRRKSTV